MDTDRSYKKTGKSYDDYFLTGNAQLTPPLYDWKANNGQWQRKDSQKSNPLLCIHINDGSTKGAPSVYPIELLVIMEAQQLANNIGMPIEEIVTDALGCFQIANMNKKRPQLTNNYFDVRRPLQHYLKEFAGSLRWTLAHPEKRNLMPANWWCDESQEK